jgi:oxalate decarboxylase
MSSFKFALEASKPEIVATGGTGREATKTTFPALDGMAIFSLRLEPGAVRIPHWHPNANELDYVVEGRAEFKLVGPTNAKNPVITSFELRKGEIGFIPQAWFHSIRNPGPGELHILVIFNADEPQDIGISIGLSGMSPVDLAETLGAPAKVFADFRQDIEFIAPQDPKG